MIVPERHREIRGKPQDAQLLIAAVVDEVGAEDLIAVADEGVGLVPTLDAATAERTVLLAEVYRRRDYWRIRAIGQGYDDGLAELATRYGVSVE